MSDAKTIIADRAAKELRDGNVVYLGIGLPMLVANYLPAGIEVIVQSENGITGMTAPMSLPAASGGVSYVERRGVKPQGGIKSGKEGPYIKNVGGNSAGIMPGAMFFDSAVSLGIIRGGHVDVTVLGALEVDQQGNIASWIVPGKMLPGMGGAMDLAVGAKKVIAAMVHTQNGAPKILKKCSLPLTAVGAIDMIITEMAVIEVRPSGLAVTELLDGHTFDEVEAATEACLSNDS
jgi:acetate CoA/acetoacetate CoA-transferase beta subunit